MKEKLDMEEDKEKEEELEQWRKNRRGGRE
jgi:hypothetical protein